MQASNAHMLLLKRQVGALPIPWTMLEVDKSLTFIDMLLYIFPFCVT